MNKNLVLLLIACLISLTLGSSEVKAVEIEKTGVVSLVQDGDTFELETGERIRFADINTPEINQSGYIEAKNYVKGLVEGKTVYLDIDDISRTDNYDRLVCVVYFDFNASHLMNLNLALLEGNYATNYDHSNNEFNPNTWNLYEAKSTIPEYPAVVMVILIVVIATLIVFKLKRNYEVQFNSPDLKN